MRMKSIFGQIVQVYMAAKLLSTIKDSRWRLVFDFSKTEVISGVYLENVCAPVNIFLSPQPPSKKKNKTIRVYAKFSE